METLLVEKMFTAYDSALLRKHTVCQNFFVFIEFSKT